MGTSIELMIGPVRLSYAKNYMGLDFGYLFQNDDLTSRRPEGASESPDEDEVENDECFARPLSRVLPRLGVLGHSLGTARSEFEAVLADGISLSDPDEDTVSDFLSFEEFCSLASLHPLASLADEYIDYATEDRKRIAQGRFAEHSEAFARLPFHDNDDMYWSEASYLSAKLCILSAPSMLQVFALNTANAVTEVIWPFGDIVSAGWVSRESFKAGATRDQTMLVATEGASDARILRRALDVLRPDVADFFRFIDGDERHHFWGTGNLVKFAEGLLRIDIQNQVLFLFDNDAEGVDAYRRLRELSFPGNMRSMILPDIDDFYSFPALGPEGLSISDINGRAAAIECYLDLDLTQYPPARVIWSNYKKEIDTWHGALEHKESYMRHFMAQDTESLTSGRYDTSKLSILLDALIAEASRFQGQVDP